MNYDWIRFLEKGDKLFNYMINNFDDMFDNNIIKHFDIRDEAIYDLGSKDIKEKLLKNKNKNKK